MRINTTRSGSLEEISVSDRNVISFPDGIIGFEGQRSFALVGLRTLRPFRLLQSVSDPWVAFLVLDVRLVRPDYQLGLTAAEEELLRPEGTQPLCLGIVTPGERPEDSTVNLLAPMVVNRARRLGKQVVQTASSYGVAERIWPDEDGTTSLHRSVG